ncbi:lysophospholipid acyltransferase family protein [Alloiococcus sp. CFN-8]|uniref:lysophospholipid acyltransferase family protein n=1 Tax=Alloiococcus sp. CFN-8 TaxID=3416081 RepID=UPI003CE6FDFD
MIKLNFLLRFKGEKAAEEYKNKVALNWSRHTLKVINMSYDAYGLDNIPSENCLFVANHQSILDVPLLIDAVKRPIAFVAKKELKKIPILRGWVGALNCLFLDRSNNREAIKTINHGIELLKSGTSMGIFPEGTRAKDGAIKEFKKGSLRLAIRSKKPIVPVAISGSYKGLEEKGRLVSARVKITFLEPIYTENISKEEQNNLTEIIRENISKYL